MKILHVLDHSIPLQSGYTFRTRAILREQHALGWETCHVTSSKHNPDTDTPFEEEVEGLKFYRTPPDKGLASQLPVANQLQVIKSLEQTIIKAASREKPDVLHAHSPALNGVAAVRAGRKLGIPVVYEVRGFWEDAAVSHGTSSENGMRYKLTRAMETWALKHADAATCICEGIRGDLIARGIPREKITIVPNAVDADRFQAAGAADPELAKSLDLQDKKVIAFIGSFYAYEGLDILVSAMPEILQACPEARLLLVGGGQVAEQISIQVNQLGLQDVVKMTGRVPNEEVERYYALTDVLAYPRKSMRLTDLVTPLKPLEAMAQECLFVASDVGGHRELVRDGDNGILFAADDTGDLAKKIISLLNTQERWPDLKKAGRRYVEEERNWTNSVSNLEAVYNNLTHKEAHAC